MKKYFLVLLLLSIAAAGCTSSTVFVRILEEPKWPVESSRSIGVVAILEDKQGRNAHLTRDFAASVYNMLKQSAYYENVKKDELTEGSFNKGKTGENIPDESTLLQLSESLGTGLLLFIEVLDSKMWIDLGSRVGYSIGFGRRYGNSAFGTSFGSGSEYWNANARMLISISLADAEKKTILASTVEDHSFYRSYMDSLPSESDVFLHMLKQAASRTVTYVDVYYHIEPRRLRNDGSKLVTDGIHYAMLGKREDWETARHFWMRAKTARPGNIAVSYNLGVAAEIQEEYGKAVEFYLNARDIIGIPEAFSAEIDQASHSEEVLRKYGTPQEVEEEAPKDEKPEAVKNE